MSSKVVEANAGIHSLAIAVAVSRERGDELCSKRFVYSLSLAGDCTVRESAV